MLLINLFKKASEIIASIKCALFLMLFLLNIGRSSFAITSKIDPMAGYCLVARYEFRKAVEQKDRNIVVDRIHVAEHDLAIQKRNFHRVGFFFLAFIGIGSIYLGYRIQAFKKFRLQKYNELQVAVENEHATFRLYEQRLDITKDLHNVLAAQLAFIISAIDNLKYGLHSKSGNLSDKLLEISVFGSQALEILRDGTWAITNGEIAFDAVLARISRYMDMKQIAHTDIGFSFKLDENLNMNRKLEALEGLNSYRIIQEALNTMLEHGSAKQITVAVERFNEQTRFTISDDGLGFHMSSTELIRSLMIMQQCAEAINGSLQFESSDHQGTKIVFDI